MFGMNEFCPVCRLRFEREQGYFLGAMYISYPISILVLGLLILVLWACLPNWRPEYVIVLAVVPYLPLTPLVFRYARILWMHFDRWGNPSTLDEHYQPTSSDQDSNRGTGL